jgi:hypothetical protein
MKRATRDRLLTAFLWLGSLFIKLSEHESRGEVVKIYVYSLYGWLVVLYRQPGEVLSNSNHLVAVVISAFISLCHVAFCYAVVRLAFWFGWVVFWLGSCLRSSRGRRR